MEDIKKVCEIRKKLIAVIDQASGRSNVSTKELGDVVDMIKDLAECEEKMYEAKYYKDKVGEGDEEKGKGMMSMLR